MALIAVFLRTDVFILFADLPGIGTDQTGVVLARIVVAFAFAEVLHHVKGRIEREIHAKASRRCFMKYCRSRDMKLSADDFVSPVQVKELVAIRYEDFAISDGDLRFLSETAERKFSEGVDLPVAFHA